MALSNVLVLTVVVVVVLFLSTLTLPVEGLKKPSRPSLPPRPFSNFKKATDDLTKFLTRNPLANIIKNSYSFFYWFPRKNIPFDSPFVLFRNSSAQFLAWYQIPHNLPPYRYLSEGYPEDFFCWGLPGNTLPLGNWDPWFLQNTSPSVMKKYRESELKHGSGFVVQEMHHPLHGEIGGLAITHMAQLLQLPAEKGLFSGLIALIGGQAAILPPLPLDYLAVVAFLSAFELSALSRHWTRWRRNEYRHQYIGNIGVGNLKDEYKNGDYGWFDVLRLRPEDPDEYRGWQERELNHGRLAMMAAIGMIFQEYATGVPTVTAAVEWLGLGDIVSASGRMGDMLGSAGSGAPSPPPFALEEVSRALLSLPDTVSHQVGVFIDFVSQMGGDDGNSAAGGGGGVLGDAIGSDGAGRDR